MPPAENAPAWDRLAAPPRDVSAKLRRRVRFGEIRKTLDLSSSMVGGFIVFFLFFGFVASFLSVAILAADAEKASNGSIKDFVPIVFAIIGPIALLGGLTMLIAIVWARGNRKLHLLRFGRVSPATITKIWDAQEHCWTGYEETAAKWKEFMTVVATRYGPWMSKLARQGRNWRCKVSVTDGEGRHHEIEMWMDLHDQVQNANLSVLCDPPRVNDAILANDFYTGLTISPDGQWAIE